MYPIAGRQSCYDRFGVKPKATDREIKKAFRKRGLVRGEVIEAKEVIADRDRGIVELNRRLLEAGIFEADDDVFYCVTQELRQAISARKQGGAHGSGGSVAGLAALADERRALRETQKQHHPPGTVPEEVR